MHPNPVFHGEPESRNLNFARARSFGVLSINGDNGPLLSHVPFLLNAAGDEARLHLMRSNPIARAGGGPAVVAVAGPDGYVSPDWYASPDQVPTWNYVAVHLRGRLEPLPSEDLAALLDAQSAHFEDRLRPKTPWSTAKMTPGVLMRLMRAIQPFRLRIDSLDGTWKLGQNKADGMRLAAAEQIASGLGQELGQLAGLMRDISGEDE